MAMFVYLRLMKSLVKSSSYGRFIKINIVVSLFLRCDLRGDLCHMYFMTHSVSVKIFLLFNSHFNIRHVSVTCLRICNIYINADVIMFFDLLCVFGQE